MHCWDAYQRIIYWIPLENVSSLLKTFFLRCPIVFGLPLKGLVLIYTFVNPFTTSFRPPGPRLSDKNVRSFFSRFSKRTPNQFDLLRYILCSAFLNWTVLLLTFTLSFIWKLSGGLVAISACLLRSWRYFFSFWLVFLFNVIFPHSLCSLSLYAGMFFFFLRKISHPSMQPSIHSLFHLSTFLSNLPAGHEKNETVAVVCRIYRFTGSDIFSSKITFLYDPCVFIFRIFNKLENITWKSVLSPTSSPFCC